MKGIVRGTRRLFVYSWREGRKIERLAVDVDDYDRFQAGDKVNVGVEPGVLGIPWFYGVYRAGQTSVPLPAETQMKPNAPKESPKDAARPAKSVNRAAVRAQRNLQFEEMTVFAETKADAFHRADVAFKEIRGIDGLVRYVGHRPLDGIAGYFDFLRVDVEHFLILDVNQQVALP